MRRNTLRYCALRHSRVLRKARRNKSIDSTNCREFRIRNVTVKKYVPPGRKLRR